MERMKWFARPALLGVLAAVLAAVVGLPAAPRPAVAAGSADVVTTFIADINKGDAAGAAATFTSDGVFTDIISSSSFALVGTPALTFGFTDTSHTHVDLVDVTASNEKVQGVGHVTDDDTKRAGVQRILQPFTAIVRSGKIAEFHLTSDETDAQTKTYVAFQTAQQDNQGPPPGSTSFVMGRGRDGSQTGQAIFFEDGGLVNIGIQIEPGPAGVPQPAHLHAGNCPGVGAIVSPLASVVNGFSFTIISMTKAQLMGGNLAVNVHKSAEAAAIYVSCGEVESASVVPVAAPAPSPAPPPPAVLVAPPAPSRMITAPATGSGPAADSGVGAFLFKMFLVTGVALTGFGTLLRASRRAR